MCGTSLEVLGNPVGKSEGASWRDAEEESVPRKAPRAQAGVETIVAQSNQACWAARLATIWTSFEDS